MDQTSLLFIALIAFALVVFRSYFRYEEEAFRNYNTNVPYGFCGVDLPPCPYPLRCVNAYCRSEDTPHMPESSGLPVLPEGYIRL